MPPVLFILPNNEQPIDPLTADEGVSSGPYKTRNANGLSL